MEIINIKSNPDYLKEYIRLCSLEWGKPKDNEEFNKYIIEKEKKILKEDKVISIIGLIDNKSLIGFVSIFKYEDDIKEFTPWYATMYVKQEYRQNGYSKILNNAILKEARKLGYNKIYLKTDLVNYYEKFGAKFLKNLNNEEKIYYINL